MTIAEKISKLQTLTTAELAAEFERLHGRAPRYRSRPWLQKRIAFAMQVAAFGGLPGPARAELQRLAAELHIPDAAPRGRTRDDDDGRGPKGPPKPGTVLRREWRGRAVEVAVTQDGFLYEGELFASLSAVAKHITGQHWSGPRFFGLVGRKQ